MLPTHDLHVKPELPTSSNNGSRRIERVFMYAFHHPGDTKHHTWSDCPVVQQIPKNGRERGDGGLPKCEKCVLAVEAHHRYLDGIWPWFDERQLPVTKVSISNSLPNPQPMPSPIPGPHPPPPPIPVAAASARPPHLASWFCKEPSVSAYQAPRNTESVCRALEEISGFSACL